MPFYPSASTFDLAAIGKQIAALWQAEETFEKSVRSREGAADYVLYEGPPSANGAPGLHHVLARTLKDLYGRYQTMRGYRVVRRGGWDTHGLPVELQAEKELGITKEEIGRTVPIEKFNQHCRQLVMRYQKEWEEFTRALGYWVELDRPYVTCDTGYISSLWHLLKQLHTAGWLYKDFSIQPYSPAAGTALSSHELNQPGCYREVQDVSVTAQFRLRDEPSSYLLAWTTTPWTLPANSGLAVNPDLTYVQVATWNRYTQEPVRVILAEAALPRYFDTAARGAEVVSGEPFPRKLPWQVTQQMSGRELLGKEYEQLLPYVRPEGKAFVVVPADFIGEKEGTGIVHLAPTFGADDQRVARETGLAAVTVYRDGKPVPIVDKQGRYVEEMGDLAGRYVKEAYRPDSSDPPTHPLDTELAIRLKQEGKAFLVEKYLHSYPHCWRTDKPILFYPVESWFIRTTALRDKLLAKNQQIHWQPATTGTGRFHNWLETVVDWNISRTRFWGTPLPVWRTRDGREEKCIGSLEELREEVAAAVRAGFMEEELPAEMDLHRPCVDEIVLASSSGEKMYREPDLVDVWFDSGAMPYAQDQGYYDRHHRPALFPADFICEGVDQTRGWFFTLHVLAVLLFDGVAYRQVLSTGLLLDKNGRKMSKRLGNVADPFHLFDSYGADAVRWYMLGNTHAWEDLCFDTAGVEEVRRKFFHTLFNTYQFFSLYANIDQIQVSQAPSHGLQLLDRWLLSRLQGLISTVRESYDSLDPMGAVRAIQHFAIEELSNWYVRLSRKRFWSDTHDPAKQAAYETLHHALATIARLAAPVAPFYMEHLFRQLHPDKASASVHLEDFPEATLQLCQPRLEQQMALAQKLASLVHQLRKQYSLKVRQPLATLLVPRQEGTQMEADVEQLLLQEVNVRQLRYITAADFPMVREARPNLPLLGKKYRAQLPAITEAIRSLSQEALARLEAAGELTLPLGSHGTLLLSREEVLCTTREIPGWAMATDKELCVALDLTLTPSLRAEGLAREAVSQLQQHRKALGLAVEDTVRVQLHTPSAELQAAIEAHAAYISQEVQITSLTWAGGPAAAATVCIDGHMLHVALQAG